MENHLFISACLLLAVAGSWSEAAPAPHTRQEADGPQDVRWRIVTGFEVTYRFTKNACGSDTLLSASEELQTILSGVCQLLEIQVLTAKVQNGSDLYAILEQNVVDSCHWLNHLVVSGEVSASDRFLELNEMCEVGDTPRLSQYCLERRLSSFYNNVYNDILQPASDYYVNTVVNPDIPEWLDNSISSEQRDSIMSTLETRPSCSS